MKPIFHQVTKPNTLHWHLLALVMERHLLADETMQRLRNPGGWHLQ
jgi:hypothetical protein